MNVRWILTIGISALVSVIGGLFIVERNNSIRLEVLQTKVDHIAMRQEKLDQDMTDRQRQLDARIMTLVRSLLVPRVRGKFDAAPEWVEEMDKRDH